MKQLNALFYEFIWRGPNKIKSNVAIKQYNQGGLQMIDVNYYEKHMKLSWLKRYTIEDGNCYKLVNSFIDMKTLLKTGKMFAEKICLKLRNKFRLHVYTAIYCIFKSCL